MNRKLPKVATRLALLTALLGPPLFVVIPNWLFGRNPELAIQIILQFLYCSLPILVAWVVIRFEHLSLESIGLRRPDWSTFISGVLLCVGILLMPPITQPLLSALGTEGLDVGLNDLALRPMWFRMIMAVTAGIVEETLYRGYAIERLATLTGRLWLGGLISVVVFALAHVPTWGVGFALGADLPFGIVMTMFYMWKRDLIANIIAHSAGLVVATLMAVP